MLNTTVLLHANILYAEIPFINIPKVVENSYIPVLESILKNPFIKVVLNFTGFTLEVLSGEFPELYPGNPQVISLLKEGIAKKQIELTGTSWAHTILPILPYELVSKDIELFNNTAQRILDYKPKGFFPPELAISPFLPALLKACGYTWCFFDKYFIHITEKGHFNVVNDFDPPFRNSFTKTTAKAKYGGPFKKALFLRSLYRELKTNCDFECILWQGAEEADIIGIGCDGVWMTYALLCLSRMGFLSEINLVKTILKFAPHFHGLFLPYSADIEFYGYGGNTIKNPVPVSRLEKFLVYLSEQEKLKLILPSEYIYSHKQRYKQFYLKSGSWSSDKNFDLWEKDADNEILNKLAQEAYTMYKEVFNHKKINNFLQSEKEKILKDLLLSFNSDGRGWTPLPEHRLFCFNKAMAVKTKLSSHLS